MSECHFAVDIGVVLIGTGMSNIPCSENHLKFMDSFVTKAYLALDEKGHIKQLYENKLGAASVGKKWLQLLFKKDRVRYFPLGSLKQRTKTKLDEAHFDWADCKYVQLAVSLPSKDLVTADADFSPKVCKILKKEEDVVVHDADSACAVIDGHGIQS